MCGVLRRHSAGEPLCCAHHSTFYRSPDSASNVELNIFRRTWTYLICGAQLPRALFLWVGGQLNSTYLSGVLGLTCSLFELVNDNFSRRPIWVRDETEHGSSIKNAKWSATERKVMTVARNSDA